MPEFIDIPDIIGNPKILQWTKDTFSPTLVQIAIEQWLVPGYDETPGFIEGGTGEPPIPGDTSLIGGGGFVEEYITNYEKNRGCAINSAVIANVRKYCKELQKHSKFKGKSCDEIILKLTEELYRKLKQEHPAPAGYVRGTPATGSMATPRKMFSAHKSVYWMKNLLMKKYGIKTKKYRIFGWTPTPPPTPISDPPVDPRSPGLPLQDIIPPGANIILPTAIQAWLDGDPFRTRRERGGTVPRNPPPRNVCTDVSSACCPPIGCDVIVIMRGHAVAGKITQCNPLKIKCEEHPLQMAGATYTLTFRDEDAPLLTNVGPPVLPDAAGSAMYGVVNRMASLSGSVGSSSFHDSNTVVMWIICLC